MALRLNSSITEIQKKNILHRLLQKSPLELFCAALNCLPFKPVEAGLFFSLQASGIMTNCRPDCGVTIREGQETDIESLTRCMNKRERFLARFRKGDRCLIAIEDTEIVGFLWFSVREVYEEELMHYRFSVPGNVVYSYDEYIRPIDRKEY